MSSLWCPSCGAEYVAGSVACSDCRVALVHDVPTTLRDPAGRDEELIELGEWPMLSAKILRRRLESAGVAVMLEWSDAGGESHATIVVPQDQAEFAAAVVNEIDVDDEVPDTSPVAYLNRIEEHLSAAAGLLDELRTKLGDEGPNGA